jgi:hypothetical protein
VLGGGLFRPCEQCEEVVCTSRHRSSRSCSSSSSSSSSDSTQRAPTPCLAPHPLPSLTGSLTMAGHVVATALLEAGGAPKKGAAGPHNLREVACGGGKGRVVQDSEPCWVMLVGRGW